MKPSTNKFILLASALCLFAACSKPQEEPAAPQTEPVPQAAAPAEKKPQPTPAPKKTQAAALKAVVRRPVLTAEQLAAELKAWDKKLNTLETAFFQTTAYDGVEISRSTGRLTYDKTQNRLRLDTLNPHGEPEQIAITDKKDIVVLDDTGTKVATLSWTEWQQGQPNQALFDFGNYTALVDRHQAKLEKQDNETAVLVLTPKEGEEYTLSLTLSKADYFPQTITLVSELLTTRADLKNIRKNQPLQANEFGGFTK